MVRKIMQNTYYNSISFFMLGFWSNLRFQRGFNIYIDELDFDYCIKFFFFFLLGGGECVSVCAQWGGRAYYSYYLEPPGKK